MGDTCVVVPYRPDSSERERAWAYLRKRYLWPVVEAEPPEGLWVKANAVMPAIERTDAEIVVVADADVWCHGLPKAIAAVGAGAGWAVPHLEVRRLARQATVSILAGEAWEGQELEQRPYVGLLGGGIVVARRSTLLSIPLDPRFVLWGQEDESWGIALWCLLGPPWRGTDPLYHLWHPAAERMTRRRGSAANWQLRRRYGWAAADPVKLRALLDEIPSGVEAGGSAARPASHGDADRRGDACALRG